MARECRKCGQYIPWTKVIDGKTRNLNGRKFCLDCSPFGQNNRNRKDPSLPPKTMRRYSEWSEEQKKKHVARVYRVALDRKLKLIEQHGGSCIKCGYSKCLRAMSFHHRDPTAKKFGLNLKDLRTYNWDAILAESKKCDLLCVRCHLELEDELASVNENNYRQLLDASKEVKCPA